MNPSKPLFLIIKPILIPDVYIFISVVIPEYLRNMTDVAIREIGYLVSHPPESIELERAKRQLQSMLFMNLEQRPVVFEDVARQVLSVGKRQQADYYFNRIHRVQAEDVLSSSTTNL